MTALIMVESHRCADGSVLQSDEFHDAMIGAWAIKGPNQTRVMVL